MLAGGVGARLGAGRNKAYLPVAERPLLAWALQPFEDAAEIDGIVVVVRSEEIGQARQVVDDHALRKVTAVVQGGATRHASERAGIEAVAADVESGEIDVACVHDAARPFASADLVRLVIETSRAHGGAAPCLEFAEPLLLSAAGEGEAAAVVPTGGLRRVQTPQAFRASALLSAHRRADEAGFAGVDTVECVQRFGGMSVRAVRGEPDNLKVTFAGDMPAVEEVVARRSGRPRGQPGTA